MSNLERNEQLVLDFFELAFNQRRVEEAVERYVGPTYTSTTRWFPTAAPWTLCLD